MNQHFNELMSHINQLFNGVFIYLIMPRLVLHSELLMS